VPAEDHQPAEPLSQLPKRRLFSAEDAPVGTYHQSARRTCAEITGEFLMEPAAFSSAGIIGLRVIHDMFAPRAEGRAGWGTGEMLREGRSSSLVSSWAIQAKPEEGAATKLPAPSVFSLNKKQGYSSNQ
jgi:hypothetical protein